MVRQFSIAFVCIALLAMSFSLVQNWSIADNNTVTFRIKSMTGLVEGSVGGLKGTVNFDPGDLSNSNMDVSLDLNTIKTGNAKRDKDIKEEEVWFDVAKYPKIGFKSDQVTKTTAGYDVDGTLTIKNTSKKVKIPFIFSSSTGGGNTFVGQLKLNRLDYSVGKSSAMVKDDVDVTITVPVRK